MRSRLALAVLAIAVAFLTVVIVLRTTERSSRPETGAQQSDPLVPRPFEISGALEHLALSPDGTFIAAVTYPSLTNRMLIVRRGVQLLDVESTGKSGKSLQWSILDTAFPSGVAIAPDGRRVAVAENHSSRIVNQDDPRVYTTEVSIWDTATGKRAATLTGSKAQMLYHAAFSPDGKYLTAGCALLNRTAQPDGGGVTVWDTDTGRVVWSDLGHKAIQTELAFSPDGNLLAAAGDDRVLRMWEANTGKPVRAIETRDYYIFSVSFSPDGRLLAGGGGDGAARVWDVATGNERHVLRGYKKSSNVREQLFVRFLPDGNLLTAGAAEKDDGSLKVWDVKTGIRVRDVANQNRSVWWLDLTADGKTAVVASYVAGTWQKEQHVWFVPLTK